MNPYLAIALTVALNIVAWAISGIVTVTTMKTYMRTKMGDFEKRLDSSDAAQKEFVRRPEFEGRVGRVENQIDRGLGLQRSMK